MAVKKEELPPWVPGHSEVLLRTSLAHLTSCDHETGEVYPDDYPEMIKSLGFGLNVCKLARWIYQSTSQHNH